MMSKKLDNAEEIIVQALNRARAENRRINLNIDFAERSLTKALKTLDPKHPAYRLVEDALESLSYIVR